MARAWANRVRPIRAGHFRDRRSLLLCDTRARINRKGEAAIGPQTTMTTKRKRWSEMTTKELAAATRDFDDPNYNPPARKPTKRQSSQLRRVQRKAAKNRF